MTPAWVERRRLAGDERDLVRRLLAGDPSALDRFGEEYVPPLYRFAQRRLAERELAREIVQSTVCKALAGLSTFRGEASLLTWLCACCRNEIAAHFRARGKAPVEVELRDERDGEPNPLHATAGAGPEKTLLRRERIGWVHAALDTLPPRYGQALEWKYLAQLPVDEIARRLAVSPKAAESLLTRARVAFRVEYQRLAGGVPRNTGTAVAFPSPEPGDD